MLSGSWEQLIDLRVVYEEKGDRGDGGDVVAGLLAGGERGMKREGLLEENNKLN